MSEPTYLKLLNSIAVNECKGEALLRAWASATTDSKLCEVLTFVAIREGEHAKAFEKRMCELGYPVCEETAYQVFDDFEGMLKCMGSKDMSDAEKVAAFGGDRSGDAKDPFTGFFNDTTIDPQTGELLGRYIAEERDSGRRLRAEYDRVCGTAMSGSGNEIAELKASIDALRQEIARMQGIRSAA